MTSFPWRIFFIICALCTTPSATPSSFLRLKDNVQINANDCSNDFKTSDHFDRVVSAAHQFTAPSVSAISTTFEAQSKLSSSILETITDVAPLAEGDVEPTAVPITAEVEAAVLGPTVKPSPSPPSTGSPSFTAFPSYRPVIIIASLSQDFLLTNVATIAAKKDEQYNSFSSSSESFVFTALKLNAVSDRVQFVSFGLTMATSSPSTAPTSNPQSERLTLSFKVISTNALTYQQIEEIAAAAASNQAYDNAISAKAFSFGATATGKPYAYNSGSSSKGPSAAPINTSRSNDSLVTPYWGFLAFVLVPFLICCCFCKAGYRCKTKRNFFSLEQNHVAAPAGYHYPPI